MTRSEIEEKIKRLDAREMCLIYWYERDGNPRTEKIERIIGQLQELRSMLARLEEGLACWLGMDTWSCS